MAEQIKDGTGSGYLAKVNSNNRLEVLAVSRSRIADIATDEADSFIIASGFISLTTTASYNGLLYIKNNSSTKSIIIGTVRVCGNGSSGSVLVKYIRNPTAGTLISDGNLAQQYSGNLGEDKVFDGLAYSASGDGKTVTDGNDFTQYINVLPGHSIQFYDGAIVIPNGKSIAIVVKPSIATTICTEVQCWFE